MASDQDLPGQFAMSIGGESIPFTMQAEVSHMTIDEAIASGLFDMPDEPGMIRIPISINVMIPNHLLWPPEPAVVDYELDDPNGMADDEAGGQAQYSNAASAAAVARSFRTMFGPAADAEKTAFRDMLKVIHRG